MSPAPWAADIRGAWNLNSYDFGPRRQNGLFVAEAMGGFISDVIEGVISSARLQIR